MNSVHWETDSTIHETSDFEVKPTFGIALVRCSLGVASCPYAVMIISVSFDFSHVSGVEITVEEDVRLPWLCEFEPGTLGDEGRIGKLWGIGVWLHGGEY